jgi:ABC-type lipoprotein release transport system permease subunit
MLALVFRTVVHFFRLLLPVALGVAVSSAVIVGALLVGDSMRGSLKHIALDRIGSIERMIVSPRWFDESAVDRAKQRTNDQSLQGMLWIQSVVAEHQDRTREQQGTILTHRVTEMSLLGVDEDFWVLGTVRPSSNPSNQQIVLNRSLADELKVAIGDRVTLKVSRDAVVPADSALGKRDSEVVALSRWEVIDVIPDESLGRFSLRSDQRPVLNAFAAKTSLQQALDLDGKINAVASSSASQEPILPALQLSLDDLGLRWQHVERIFPDNSIGESASARASIYSYDQLTSQQMMIPDALADAIESSKPTLGSQSQSVRILSYLANGTQVIGASDSVTQGRSVPYSIIAGAPWDVVQRMLAQSPVPVDPMPDGNPRKDWVVVHQWMADELRAKVGDRLKIDYFLPETVEGTEIEQSFEATVVSIAPLTEPQQPFRRKTPARFGQAPTPFNDPAWTPLVPGITDQESISNWETPFALTRKIEKQDDEYWNSHRLTPKLYISDERARELFGSRFGSQTSIRFDGLNELTRDSKGHELLEIARDKLSALGWRELPLREQQLRAASGTTPFDALFLSLSFFVIAAALILVALLFRLTIEKRADHWGLLLASGWTRSKLRRLLLLESSLVAAIGSALGVALGVGYAYGLLAGLKTWWVGAISVSFLDFYIRPPSLWIGWLAGLMVSIMTTWLVTRQLRRSSVARLLKGRMDDQAPNSGTNRWITIGAAACLFLGLISLLAGQWVQGQAQAGAFVGSGMLWMIAMVLWLYTRMSLSPSTPNNCDAGLSSLARSNAYRAPLRSILTVALMSIASFLILAMSLFQAQPDRRGTGGLAWVAKSSQSIHVNVADAKQQRQTLADQAEVLVGTKIIPVRVRGGDDASCNNLYQASEPQVMGVSASIKQIDIGANGRSELAWFGTDTNQSPWERLESLGVGTKENPVPVILDQNTALWALHLGGYVGEKFSYKFGESTIHFQTVGVLQNTILQGSLWIGERNFQKVFPDIGGYRTFLVKPPIGSSNEQIGKIRTALESGWADEGLSCASADGILSRLLAVQNTYLSAFQLLGGLGLLLGTLGLGVSQLRSALERKSELAAMRAMGFPKGRLIWMLFMENGWQLFRGLGIGLLCALAASVPVILQGNSAVSLRGPLAMLAFVIVFGLAFCVIAAFLAMREPLMGSLRSDR